MADEIVESFHMDLPSDGIAVTGGPKMPLARLPDGIAALTEPALVNSLMILTRIRDGAGQIIGYATELEVFPDEPTSPALTWDTNWVVVIPSRGTLYLHEYEQLGRLNEEIIGPMMESGRDWEGQWERTTTVGPRADGTGEVVGGTGEFAGATGSFVEINRLYRFTLDRVMYNRLELRVTWRRGAGASAAWPWR